jgi:hypothetical protein
MGPPDLSPFPPVVRDKAPVRLGDVCWRTDDAEAAIRAIAATGYVVLGLDLQKLHTDGGVMELAWSNFEPDRQISYPVNVDASRRAALEALARDDKPSDFEWVRVV